MMEKSDKELVALSLKNQENFLFLIKKYEDKLSSYIRRLTNASNEDIEDILQEVFIKTYLNLNDFDYELKFSSWIYRITHNEVISHHRKLQARPQGHYEVLDEDALDNISSELDIPKELDNKLLKNKIFEVLNKLKDKQKEIIVLKFFEEKTYEEISDIIKKPMGTVASLMNRSKKEFKKEFKIYDKE